MTCYGHERYGISPLSSVNFDDIWPISIQAAFMEIHQALRTGAVHAAEDSIKSLRRAADSYVEATRNSHGF